MHFEPKEIFTLAPMQVNDNSRTYDIITNCCSNEWQKLLSDKSNTIRIPKGAQLFIEGEKMNFMHVVKEGKFKVSMANGDHQEKIVRLAGNGQIIGHRGFGGDYIYPISATALEESTVQMYPISDFKNALHENGEFSYKMMTFFAEELKRSEKQMRNLTTLEVKYRVAKALQMNMEAFGYDKADKKLLSFTLSRKDISSIAGTTYESVIRSLSSLVKDEIIELKGKSIRIKNSLKLKKISGEV